MSRKLLEQTLPKDLTNIIITYMGNECEKCNIITEHPLTVCLSFTNGTYAFTDIPNSDYKLKKFCKNCTYSRCSSIKIYLEVQDRYY